MNRTILQIPMDKSLRDRATKAATDHGFSSLQEAVRVLLHKFSTKELTIDVASRDERLSEKAERRYTKIVEDIKKGKGVTKTQSVNELIALLTS